MNLLFDKFESLGEYHDHWALVILCAPDNFFSDDDAPVNQAEALKEAFDVLKSGISFVEER